MAATISLTYAPSLANSPLKVAGSALKPSRDILHLAVAKEINVRERSRGKVSGQCFLSWVELDLGNVKL